VRVPSVLAVLSVAGLVLGACSGGSGSSQGSPATQQSAVAASTTTSTLAPTLDSPAAVAGALTQVERGLRAVSDPNPATLGTAQQRAYETLVAHPEWRTAALALIPADIASAVTSNLDAGVSLDALTSTGPAATTLPSWTIRAPQPEATLLADYHAAEAASGVPWAYLAGIHLIESRLGRIMGPSNAGAQGPMQFEPSTWAEYGQGTNIDDDHDAILAAGRFLAAHGGAANISRALLSYNNDSRYVRAVTDYATVLLAAPAAYDGYYEWQVEFQTASGTFVLPVGYPTQPALRIGG
jgi:membrane-bound lytic murein transglycosylase B